MGHLASQTIRGVRQIMEAVNGLLPIRGWAMGNGAGNAGTYIAGEHFFFYKQIVRSKAFEGFPKTYLAW